MLRLPIEEVEHVSSLSEPTDPKERAFCPRHWPKPPGPALPLSHLPTNLLGPDNRHDRRRAQARDRPAALSFVRLGHVAAAPGRGFRCPQDDRCPETRTTGPAGAP